MSRKKKTSKKKNKKEKEELNDEPGIIEMMGTDTIKRIVGILLFVFAILLILSALKLAGIAGDKIFGGIFYVVGIGYWLLPILLTGLAWSFVNNSYEQNRLRKIRLTGGVLFFLSSLAIISVSNNSEGGVLGLMLAKPLLKYLDTIATLVILFGVISISLLLLFDGELWMSIKNKLLKSTGKKEIEVDELEEDAEIELEDTETNITNDKNSNKESGNVEENENFDDYKIEDVTTPTKTKKTASHKKDKTFQLPSEYKKPPLSILEGDRGKIKVGDTKIRANIIRKTLQHFKIPVEMDEVVVGPTVTRYSLKPAAGVRLSRITQLQPNLELALAASPIRIEAPIPGKSLVGIEVPNSSKAVVGLNSLVSSSDFLDAIAPLFVALGKDIAGNAHFANIGKMPHLLVAGTTGSGKSVMIHSIINSILYKNGPERVRFIMVDPKRVELTLYNKIPHLLTPVITDAKKCILSLKWAAKEMERRYDILQEHEVQNIAGYHNKVVAPIYKKIEKAKKKGKDTTNIETPEAMPHIVIIIDELSDIMSAYPKELEAAIVRLAQKSRAVGIHLVLSTQRPSAQVITGLIKANIPTRIALKVSSLLESRIILDQGGAEKLLGAGDMLYLSSDMAKPKRIQSPFLTTEEVKKIVAYIAENNTDELDAAIDFSDNDGNGQSAAISFDKLAKDDELDEIYDEVREFIVSERKASTSLIQRRFRVGYGRAARIIDQLEQNGVISAQEGTNKPRKVLEFAQQDTDTVNEEVLDEEQSETEYE